MKLRQNLGNLVISVAIGAAGVLYSFNAGAQDSYHSCPKGIIEAENYLSHLRIGLMGSNPKRQHEKAAREWKEFNYRMREENLKTEIRKEVEQISEVYRRLTLEAEKASKLFKEGDIFEGEKLIRNHPKQTEELAERLGCTPESLVGPYKQYEKLIGLAEKYGQVLGSIR
ncbi:hypothetical protein HYX17_04520 [Candidatus Woesearchaeota archaeon]|nr:hypothetical protein [Candidatus Woesearchaeota archaeon]